jgi:hypothetical protein
MALNRDRMRRHRLRMRRVQLQWRAGRPDVAVRATVEERFDLEL